MYDVYSVAGVYNPLPVDVSWQRAKDPASIMSLHFPATLTDTQVQRGIQYNVSGGKDDVTFVYVHEHVCRTILLANF